MQNTLEQSRFRCDGIPIDHMQTSNDTGVLSWITSGRCDLVADIRFPRQDDQVDLSAIVDHLVDEIGGRLGGPAAATHNRTGPIPGRRSLSRDALEAPRSEGHELTKKEERRRALQFAKEAEKAEREQQRFAMLDDEDLQQERENETDAPSVDDEEDKIVSIDLDIRFRDLKASVPVGLFSRLTIIHVSGLTSLFPAVFHVGPVLHQQRPRPTHRGLHQPEPDPDPDPVPHRPRPERVQRQLDDVRRRHPRSHVGAGL